MIFDLLTPPQGPRGGAKKNAVARPFHVSKSHTKFGWIASNGLGDSIKDRRTDGRRLLQLDTSWVLTVLENPTTVLQLDLSAICLIIFKRAKCRYFRL